MPDLVSWSRLCFAVKVFFEYHNPDTLLFNSYLISRLIAMLPLLLAIVIPHYRTMPLYHHLHTKNTDVIHYFDAYRIAQAPFRTAGRTSATRIASCAFHAGLSPRLTIWFRRLASASFLEFHRKEWSAIIGHHHFYH
jgi:hypothetical protein